MLYTPVYHARHGHGADRHRVGARRQAAAGGERRASEPVTRRFRATAPCCRLAASTCRRPLGRARGRHRRRVRDRRGRACTASRQTPSTAPTTSSTAPACSAPTAAAAPTGSAESLNPDNFINMRHPRTLIGVDGAAPSGSAAIDGRQPIQHRHDVRRSAAPLRPAELTDALNLDGGGSTTMVVKGGW